MNALQKQAWLTVIMAVVSVAAFGGLCPWMGPSAALSGFSLFGFTGFGALFFRKAPLDERDRAIARRAVVVAFVVSYEVFILLCMGTWAMVYALHGNEQVSVHILALITGAGGIVAFTVHAVAILVLYRSRVEADHG
jgi:hypothetical protein